VQQQSFTHLSGKFVPEFLPIAAAQAAQILKVHDGFKIFLQNPSFLAGRKVKDPRALANSSP
jgi:hypothetical protein